MLQHLNKILLQFQICFNRKAIWKNFVVLVIGFMLRTNHRGVTSTLSSLRLEPKQYHALLHFYRSTGYETTRLYDEWINIARKEATLIRMAGYFILLGDHIKIPKEGRRMPDIQVIRQESENSGKGEYIEGHTYAQISALITNGDTNRSLPLMTEQQKSPPRKNGTKEPDRDTLTGAQDSPSLTGAQDSPSLVTQMVNLAAKTVQSFETAEKAITVLDAYFSKASAFFAADKAVDGQGNRKLEIITRGRDDSVGYADPLPRPKGKRGAPQKYGERIALWSLFTKDSRFTETVLTLYGKSTKVRYKCLDLIWKPLQDQRKVRFVLVDTDRGRMILMSSDLTLGPEEIISIYCLRFKIETSFDEQKNDMGIFSYRFWTRALPKRKRWAKNGQVPSIPPSARVNDAKRAIDSFVCLGTIASGICTIIAFSHNRQIWKRFLAGLGPGVHLFPPLPLPKRR
jgi:hypothetical protein